MLRWQGQLALGLGSSAQQPCKPRRLCAPAPAGLHSRWGPCLHQHHQGAYNQFYEADVRAWRLPSKFNAKPYHAADPRRLSDAAIVHFHGPKVRMGAQLLGHWQRPSGSLHLRWRRRRAPAAPGPSSSAAPTACSTCQLPPIARAAVGLPGIRQHRRMPEIRQHVPCRHRRARVHVLARVGAAAGGRRRQASV